MKSNTRFFLSFLAPLILIACSDSDSNSYGNSSSGYSDGSITQNTNLNGVISGFGSVIVDGVHYDTKSASVKYDDSISIELNDLQVGMIVDLEGYLAEDGLSGEATTIVYNEQVCGKITWVDTAAQELSVFGQMIHYDEQTVFYGFDEDALDAELLPDTLVAISGYVGLQGEIYATRIAQKDSSNYTKFKAEGKIKSLNTASQTFELNDLVINYQSSSLIGVDAASLANGQIVRLKGNVSALTSNVFSPSHIKLVLGNEAINLSANTHRGMAGVINSFTSSTDFMVRNMKVTTNAQTQFIHGTSENLELNQFVRIKGKANSNNQVVADSIVFYKTHDLMLEGVVSAIDYQAGTVTIRGKTFKFNKLTQLDDMSDFNSRELHKAGLGFKVGNHLKISGFKGDQGELVAGKIRRKDHTGPSDEFILRGLAENVTSAGMTVEGIAVIFEVPTLFFDAAKIEISPAEFFAELQAMAPNEQRVDIVGKRATLAPDVTALMVALKPLKSVEPVAKKIRFVGKLESVTGSNIDAVFNISGKEVVFEASPHLLVIEAGTELSLMRSVASPEDFIQQEVPMLTNPMVEVQGYKEANGQIKAKSMALFSANTMEEASQLAKKPYQLRPGARPPRKGNNSNEAKRDKNFYTY